MTEPASASLLTIGQLADYVGVTVRAIRHYHQRGLLAEPERDASGYRRYGAQAVIDLIRIKILSDAGVPLARIMELLDAAPDRLAQKRADLADPEFQRLYRGYDEAVDWDPEDPRVEQLADAVVHYLERSMCGRRGKSAPGSSPGPPHGSRRAGRRRSRRRCLLERSWPLRWSVRQLAKVGEDPYLELRSSTGVLVGVFTHRQTALRVAAEVLADGVPHVLLQTFDEQRELVCEAVVSRRRRDD